MDSKSKQTKDINSSKVFISYSRADIEIVRGIVADLQQTDIDIWLDLTELEPGTADWQKEIRNAIQKSTILILIASPNSCQSVYVQAELSLAKRYKVKVLPVWIQGNDWVDSVPLELVNYQYIDLRNTSYKDGLNVLIGLLKSEMKSLTPPNFIFDADNANNKYINVIIFKRQSVANKWFPPGWMLLENAAAALLNDHQIPGYEVDRIISFVPVWYEEKSMQYFLNDLYVDYLKDRYPPFSYGKEWILASVSSEVSRLAVPWIWLQNKQKELSLFQYSPNWAETTKPSDYGLLPDSWWGIIEGVSNQACGLVTSEEKMAALVKSLDNHALKYVTHYIYHAPVMGVDDVEPTDYKYAFVVHQYFYHGVWGKVVKLTER